MKKILMAVLVLIILFNTNVVFAANIISDYKDTNKQVFTANDIQKALDLIPTCYTNNLDIYLLETSKPTKTSALASYLWDKNTIYIYRTDINEGRQYQWTTYNGVRVVNLVIKEELNHIITHEVGHHVSNVIFDDYFQYYEDIYERTKKFDSNNILEDFAESWSMYMLDTENFRKNCPSKYIYFEMIRLLFREDLIFFFLFKKLCT